MAIPLNIAGISEAFARSSVVERDRSLGKTNGLEQIQRSDRYALERLDWLLKREGNRALSCEIVHLVRRSLAKNLDHAPEIRRSHRLHMNSVAYAESLEIRKGGDLGIAGGAVNFVTLVEKKASEICAILSRDATNQRARHLRFVSHWAIQ